MNVASLAAEVGLPGLAAYTASKAGVAGLTRQAAVEYAAAGIRINALAPGMIETPMITPNPPEARAAFLEKTPAGRPGSRRRSRRPSSSWRARGRRSSPVK